MRHVREIGDTGLRSSAADVVLTDRRVRGTHELRVLAGLLDRQLPDAALRSTTSERAAMWHPRRGRPVARRRGSMPARSAS